MSGQTPVRWLLAVVAGLSILRWVMPPGGADADGAVAEAVVRAPAAAASAPRLPLASQPPLAGSAPAWDVEVAGNPFAVRTPPPPPAPVPAPVVTVQAPLVVQAPPPPVAVAAPPLKVIGTWDDGTGLAAFVAGPNTTLLARPGVVLMGEYSVTAVTKQQVTLVHVPSKRDVRLPVPREPGA